MTKQSKNLLNSLMTQTQQSEVELQISLSMIVKDSLTKQTNELLDKAQKDYANGNTYKDDLGMELTIEEVEVAIKSRFGRYLKWDFEGIKTFNERMLKDIAYGLNLKYEAIENLPKEIKAKQNGVLVFKDGSTYDFVEFKDGKVVNPQVLYSAPKMLANGKFHRFNKEVVATISK